MPDRIFIDTSFILALQDRRDQYHMQAQDLAIRYEGFPLLLTDAILLEVGNALARGFKVEAAAVIEEFLTSDEAKIAHLTPALFDQAFEYYKLHQDKDWGLVDCLSFITMLEEGVTSALTFDHHFTQAGFQVLQ